MEPSRPGSTVDASGAKAVQVGDRNIQINHFHLPEQRTSWPVRVGAVPPLADSLQARQHGDLLAEGFAQAGVTTQILSGMGGVGKTQLAAGYADRAWRQQQVDLLVWVTAESRAAIVDTYAEAARHAGIGGDPTSDQAADRLLSWLAGTDKRWLVVLDDVADLDHLRGLWPPPAPAGSTLVTTRERTAALAAAGRRRLDVDLFTAQQSHDFLAARLADHPELADDIDGLAADLHHLPLALAQAAVYLIDGGRTCTWYRAALADTTRQLAHLAPARLPGEHRHPVAAAWKLSIDRADLRKPEGLARPVLQLASLLDPNGIPAAVLMAPAALSWLSRMTGVPVGEEHVYDAVRSLHVLNLATHDPGNATHSLRVHALVQRATADQSPTDVLDSAALATADALVEVWPNIEMDPAMGQALRSNASRLHQAGPDVLWTHADGRHPVLARSGRSLGEAGQAVGAAAYFSHLADAAQRRLGPGHRHTLWARGSLAYWRGMAGDPAAAADEFEQLLADRLRLLGPDHPDALLTRSHLARWRGAAGDRPGALIAFEELLVDRLRILGPDHPATLTTRSHIARSRGRVGDAPGAVAEFERLLADRLRLLGPDHPDTLNTRNSLAVWRGRAGDLAGAIAGFEQLLADRVRLLGPDHRDTLLTRAALAGWRGESGDPAGAAAALEELSADRMRVLGPDDADLEDIRADLARWRAAAE